MPNVPYDADPRPLRPTNRNLKAVPEECGPNPTQDGPHRGTAPATEDALGYLNMGGPEWSYLEHFRAGRFVREGHNTRAGVSRKISKLMHEGKPQKQAVAMSLAMERAHRLSPTGEYRRVGRKKK